MANKNSRPVKALISRKLGTYRQILKHFGFERVTGQYRVKGVINFTHPKNNWYAEIIKYDYSQKACWIIGSNISNSNGYPGGKHCDTPEELYAKLETARQGLTV